MHPVRNNRQTIPKAFPTYLNTLNKEEEGERKLFVNILING
jgi:hypothetical protein